MKMHKFCGCAGISSHLLSVSVLVASLCASAATNYVVPWYANPVATNVVYDALLVNDPADATIAAKITTAWATVSGADVLSGKTSLVKTMGDTTYFRPKFYVLCTDGDIVEFTMAKDLSSAVWTNALTAAKLATAASASGTASDLQVSDDGRLAFLNYGGIWKALGYKPPTWTLHVLDSNGEEVTDVTVAKRDYLKWVKEDGVTRQYVRNDIENGGSAYITDGTFQIGIYNYYGGVGLGTFGDSTANAFRGDGVSEFLDMSAGVCRFAGGNFSIRASTEYALGIPTGGRTARVILHSTRIESIRRIMGGWAGGYEEVVIDTASIPDTSLNNTRPEQYGDGFTPTVKRLVFNVPNLTLNQWGTFPYAPPKVGDVSPPITNAAIAAESRWEDFNFDNITWTSGAVLYNFDCGGILSLPVVTNVGSQAFAWNTAVTHESTTPVEVRLSPKNKTLRIIGKQAFYGQTNIWRVVIGGHDDGVLFAGADATYPQHFAGMKLKEVEFTGGLPMFEANMGNWVFNNPSGAKSFVFVVPREARWTSFLEGSFRPANDNEIRDYMAANPGRYVPFGVITNNTLLHTTDNQFVAYADSFGNGAPFTFAPEFNSERGSVSMTVIGGNQPDGLGRYEPGTIVRFTATPAAGFTFRKWYGDTGTNDATSASIDIPIEKGTWIHARFTGGWTITGYDSAAKTAKATDGNFKINLSAMDASKHTFTLGDPNQTIGGLFDIEYTDNGDGTVTTNMMANSSILDLGGEFHLEGDATPWRATAFANVSSVGVFPIAYLNVVNTFISPGTITSGLKRSLFNFGGDLKKSFTGFATVILDEPSMPGSIYGYNFAGASRVVSKLALQVPMVGSLPDNAFWNIQAASDLATWDLSSVSNITPKAMTTQYISNNATTYLKGRKAYNCHGELSLPALRQVSVSAEGGSALSPMPYVTSLNLGGKTAADTVTSLGNGAFAGNSSMTNLVIHADASITVGTGIFADHEGRDTVNARDVVYPGHTPEYMTFTGAAPNTDIFANLLADIGAGDKPVKITAKKYTRGWNAKPYIDYSLTAEEKALAGEDADKVFGVYRGVSAGVQVVKAYFLLTAPPKGLRVVFR